MPYWEIYSVRAKWGLREDDREACGARLKAMLDIMRDAHPGYVDLVTEGAKGAPGERLYDLCARPVDLASRFLPGDKVYDPRTKRRFTDGLKLHAVAGSGEAWSVMLDLRVGHDTDHPEQFRHPNSVSIALHSRGDKDEVLVARALDRTLGAIIAWQPDIAVASSYNYGQKRRRTDSIAITIGAWIVYLNGHDASKVIVPPGTTVAPIPDGGAFLLATTDMFSASDPEHLAAADALHAAIAPLGY